MEIREYLRDNILLFDGAMGTYYAARNPGADRSCEWANLTAPEEVEAIHRAYTAAGARALKTNTFAANRPGMGEACERVIRAGWAIAQKAAGDAFVFADIGPAEGEPDRLPAEYRYLADLFLDLGAKHFLFETQSRPEGIPETAAYIKSRRPEAFILLSFAAQPDGFTGAGRYAPELVRAALEDANMDGAGFNCVCGAHHVAELAKKLGPTEGNLVFMPNAGYPTVGSTRVIYRGQPGYFAAQTAALRAQGARILGGCCGTTPEHIAALAEALRGPAVTRAVWPVRPAERPAREESGEDGPFWRALADPARKPVAVELDPPENADTARFLAGARTLAENGADLITIADCPIARARMDSSLLACKLQRELGVEAMPHMTCRDRNLNATQALLLGLCAEGVRNVLLVTGDPIPSASRDEVKSVYNFNSRGLIRYAAELNRVLLPRPFRLFAALNVNARNFSLQLRLAREKEEAGADGFFTQPVLTERALDNLRLARETLRGRLLGGIIPVVSHRNALFMNSEIAGIDVDERIVSLYEGADRARGEELAVEVSAAVAGEIAPYIDGFYLMTPFGRAELMARIMARLRAEGLA